MTNNTLPDLAREAIELVNTPGGDMQFQRQLMAAEMSEARDLASVGRLIALSHAALAVCSAGWAGMYESWYVDKAKALMVRAMDGVAALEAKMR